MMNKNHPFHLVNYSPWPIFSAILGLFMFSGLIKWFHEYKISLLMMSMLIMMRESTF